VVAYPNLYFNPPTSPEDNDNPDYEQSDPIQPFLIESDESGNGSLPAFSHQNISFLKQSVPRESPKHF
jgi:hypothetical protein